MFQVRWPCLGVYDKSARHTQQVCGRSDAASGERLLRRTSGGTQMIGIDLDDQPSVRVEIAGRFFKQSQDYVQAICTSVQRHTRLTADLGPQRCDPGSGYVGWIRDYHVDPSAKRL